MSHPVFISHTSKDDQFVKALREKLAAHGISTWVDERELVAGDKLAPEIEQAIETARAFIAVLSPYAVNSRWVSKEIHKALEVEAQRQGEGYRVIPVMLPGIEVGALTLWFGEAEPVGLPIQTDVGGLDVGIIPLLEALGERLPDDRPSIRDIAAAPVDELILRLRDPHIEERDGTRRAAATATLIYDPADPGKRKVESQRFQFTAPLGVIEHAEIRWYLEEYYRWPVGVFKQRAEHTEEQLPVWGQALYRATLGMAAAHNALTPWQSAPGAAARRLSIEVDADPILTADDDDSPQSKIENQQSNEAASALLALPWELLHDGRSYLFQGRTPVRVRRRLPNRHAMQRAIAELPIRILLVSPRPDDEHAGYIDHRLSAQALVSAVENLGALVEFDVLTPPNFAALRAALEQAVAESNPYEVIHFDGHGVYDAHKSLGALVFENPRDAGVLSQRRSTLVDAGEFAALMRDYRIPLVFLEACQSAQFEHDPTASVAAQLLDAGVTSVAAMTHSVLVETARRFTQAFYRSLAAGARVGDAMLAGQKALAEDSYRIDIMGAGELHLQDWFVPVLYQEKQDPQLFDRVPDAKIQELGRAAAKLSLGALPEPPAHSFIGRSRELLALERLLLREGGDDQRRQYAVIVGTGGAGKTTIAVELAQWLARTQRFDRVAFASLEFTHDARALLDTLGRQLCGENYSVAEYGDDQKAARLPIERALRDQQVLLLVDNVETILTPNFLTPNESGLGVRELGVRGAEEIFALLQNLLTASPQTRLLLTSRETLPAPFDLGQQHLRLGALSQRDAVDLVSHVMTAAGHEPPAADPGETPEEVTALVEAVGRHARALVLIAREVASRGVRGVTRDLGEIMAALEARYPGQRENSLFASVELSLRRLTDEGRRMIKPLGAFYGGCHLATLAMVLEIEPNTASQFTNLLISVGLAQPDEYNYLHLDPALPPYLWGQMSAEEQAAARARWGQAMRALVGFLHEQWFQNAQMASRLVLLELPNLLAALDWAAATLSPEEVVDLAGSVEQLLANLDRPRALALAVAARERAAKKLGEWSKARFNSEVHSIERLLAAGNLPAAHEAAQKLLQRALTAGEGAYPGADYDIAFAYTLLGSVLQRGGAAAAALEPLNAAQVRFEALGAVGNQSAARMASVAIASLGDCLQDVGRLDDAAKTYEDGIQYSEKLGDQRQIAAVKGQLGTVRMLQRRYQDSLDAHAEARAIFEGLGEPQMVATAWHQTGMVYRETGDYAAAERAYRQSLAIKVGRGDRRGQATSLTELGNLYNKMGRLEEAVTFYRQAADIYVEIGDSQMEGRVRSNIGNTLIKLQRYDEARRELLRAVECDQHYGHAAETWKTWYQMEKLEKAVGDESAAARARAKSKAAYLSYRRDGGYAQPFFENRFGITEAELQ